MKYRPRRKPRRALVARVDVPERVRVARVPEREREQHQHFVQDPKPEVLDRGAFPRR